MKQLRLTTAATVLALALSFSAFAGEMDTGFTSQSPTQSTATAAGEMGTTAATTSTATAVNPLTQIMLALLNLLP